MTRVARKARQASLVPVPGPPEPTNGGGLVSMIERMACNPDVDVSKLEKLIALQERALGREAEQQANAAMTAAQTEIGRVAADASNPQTKSRYASYGALDRVLRPIYTKHGFGLSFDTGEGATAPDVRVLCYVTHIGGYSRTYHVDVPADGKGAKGGDVMTRTHAVGSAMSYGMRYLLKFIFNVAVGEDDDGNAAGSTPKETTLTEPKGYADWVADMEITAEQGTAVLQATWKQSRGDYRTYLIATQPERWTAIKAKAEGRHE